ncbi:hypothetical protein BESB_069640 [Besnoitia besnoiti]|uniref:Trichohyalin n=1 Tax=Besnoitia besnoiti TaxID=94643 RepID=A0A2A9MF95_BESBE|nr:hypothetical protein BESB_069640 [Besnoitia besnoiti]PFH34931.1 hypothetical protein BESB_069640 [Besnoitia besnoiti]
MRPVLPAGPPGPQGGGSPLAGTENGGVSPALGGGEALDLDMVEKLKQKYIKCKQQNDRLKQVLLQMQQDGEQRASAQQQEQVATLQKHVEQLQQQLKVREMEQRQHMEELDTLQYTNRKQKQQLQLLQQQAAAAAATGAAGGGGAAKWGIGLLSGATAGSAAKEENEKRLMEELQVLRDELEHKIRENEQLHVQQFEEKQQQQVQQERLERLDEELQQERHVCQQFRQERDEAERRVHTHEALLCEERERKREVEERLREVKTETRLQLTRLSEQKDRLAREQGCLRRYVQRRLPVDLRRLRLLACYDLPCGGCGTVVAACVAAQRQVASAIASLLVRLQQLLAAWAEALRSGGGRTGGADLRSGKAAEGHAEGAGSPGARVERSLSDEATAASAAGLVAIGAQVAGRPQAEGLVAGAAEGARHHPHSGGGTANGGGTTAAVSGIHFKLTVANQKALDALLEARKSINSIKRYLLRKLVAPSSGADRSGAPGPTRLGGEEASEGRSRGGQLGGQVLHRGRAKRGLERETDGADGDEEAVALEARRGLRHLGVAFRRFTSYSLVSLTLETDAFPILDGNEKQPQNGGLSFASGETANAFDSFRWSSHLSGPGAGAAAQPRSQTGDARRSTTAFIEASRRLDKSLSLLLEVAQLLFFSVARPQNTAEGSEGGGTPRSPFLANRTPRNEARPNGCASSECVSSVSKPRTGPAVPRGGGQCSESEAPSGTSRELAGFGSPPCGGKEDEDAALARLSGEHFRLLKRAVSSGESDLLCEELSEADSSGTGEGSGTSEECERRAGERPLRTELRGPHFLGAFRFEDDQDGKKGDGELLEAARRSAVAQAVAISAMKHDVAKQMLQQVFLKHLERAMMCMATMEGCISARMCRPHVVEGHLLPLSGGGNAMVNLVQAAKLIDSYMPISALLPHLSGVAEKPVGSIGVDAKIVSASHLSSLARRDLGVAFASGGGGLLSRAQTTTSSSAILREGLQLLFSSRLTLWVRFLHLPVLDSALHELKSFMKHQREVLRDAPPRMLRDDAVYFREEVQRLAIAEQRLEQQLESVRLDFDEVLEERAQLLQDAEELRGRHAIVQARLELARGPFASGEEAAEGDLENVLESGTRRDPDDVCVPSKALQGEDAAGSEGLDAAMAAAAAAEDACAATSRLMVMASEGGCLSSPEIPSVLGCSSREAAAAMIKTALLQHGSVYAPSSGSALSAAAASAAAAVVAALECQESSAEEAGKDTKCMAGCQRELRQTYVQQVQQLLQHIQTSEDALAALKMQLSSCLKTIHSLGSQRQQLQRQIQEQRSAATEAASAARLAEVKYMEQLSLLSEHYCQEGEKRKVVEVLMEDVRQHRILCGRCGVWNSLGSLLDADSGGTCTMCHGRVIEPPT